MKRDYYTLNESAQMMGLTVDDLISLGINEKLKIIVLVKNKAGHLLDSHLNTILPYTVISDRYFYVRKESLEVYESEKTLGKVPMLDHGKKSDNSGNHWKLLFEDEYIPLTENSLFILSDDIKHYAEQQPEAVKIETINQDIKQSVQSKTALKSNNLNSDESRKRENQLHIFIWRVFQSFDEPPTAQKLWNEIQHRHQSHDENKIIQEVDGNQILWISSYSNEQKLKRKSFDKTLSVMKKNHLFKNIYRQT